MESKNRKLDVSLTLLHRAIRAVIRDSAGGMNTSQLLKLLDAVRKISSFVAQMSHKVSK